MGLRKLCDQYRPYSNCVTLRGQLSNWTSEDIVEVATKNIETIIEPIRDELTGETNWDKIGSSSNENPNTSNDEMNYGNIGDSVTDKEYQEDESVNAEEGYEWRKL